MTVDDMAVRDRIVTGRTAALSVALRRGDALGAARAAARLRLPAVPLTREQLGMARRARTAVGRQLVHARWFPATERDVIAPPVAPRPLRRPSYLWRWLLAGFLAGLVVFLVLLLMRPSGPGGSSGAANPNQPATVVDVTKNLRGRTSAAPSIVVVVTAPPTVAPTSAPTATGSPAASPLPGSSGGGGGGTGSGGGGLGGDQTPPPGFRIFTLDVIDSDSGRPLPNVCVHIGQPTCDARYLTNDIGRWTWQISKSDTTKWDMELTLTAYNIHKESFTVLPGDDFHKLVQMTRSFGGG